MSDEPTELPDDAPRPTGDVPLPGASSTSS